ncbi:MULTISPECIES: hypothetical protein [unclassified Pseudomonas]|uniref:hypothetical protein n=1 Tax=unclassified Pseudomonas TaxID=196821 RepID=UPI000D3457E8|nr:MULTISPECIES: hypothetical protein [unclassified Pseudomonas]RAU49387.1 hypothetical protein DBP26_000850 [Pseudomonas sp. RIT 409]RAU55873.1 hypothetical protein DBY65_001670 [Pseudomonas sp. RIT 412]
MTTGKPLHDPRLSVEPHCPVDEDPVTGGFHSLVHEQASYGIANLIELHRRWMGPRGLFATFDTEIERMGRQAPSLQDMQSLECPERAQAAERALAFALGKSQRRVDTPNPLGGFSREALCCIAFGADSGYTLVERYTAYEAIREYDSAFFIKLIATTRGVSERRIVFRGLLEHYDRLTPLEKCIFPVGYRAVQAAHLEREEAVNGKWMFEDDVATLLEKLSPLELLKQVMASAAPRQESHKMPSMP